MDNLEVEKVDRAHYYVALSSFLFSFFLIIVLKDKKFADKAISLENWSILLWVEDRTKPPPVQEAILCG